MNNVLEFIRSAEARSVEGAIPALIIGHAKAMACLADEQRQQSAAREVAAAVIKLALRGERDAERLCAGGLAALARQRIADVNDNPALVGLAQRSAMPDTKAA